MIRIIVPRPFITTLWRTTSLARVDGQRTDKISPEWLRTAGFFRFGSFFRSSL